MTIEMQRPKELSTETTEVRVVDSDIHPTPKRGELTPFLPERFRSLFENRATGAGSSVYYDAPVPASA